MWIISEILTSKLYFYNSMFAIIVSYKEHEESGFFLKICINNRENDCYQTSAVIIQRTQSCSSQNLEKTL